MEFKVIFTTPSWDLSGVNTFTANLIEELSNCGITAILLITNPPRQNTDYTMPLPSNIIVEKLAVEERDNWKIRWQKMIDYLEQKAPCIYIPNYDVNHSCISPKLANSVGIVGIIHSDDPFHYDHVSRLGEYWNGIVSVSKAIEKKAVEFCPNISQRSYIIPYGVNVPETWQQRTLDVLAPLKLVYAGRLVQKQKRVFDLPKIVETLLEMGITVELTIIGDGSEGEQLRDICQPLTQKGTIRFLGTLANEKVLELYEQNDIFILTSDFEGLPVSLLEAMARGCIPVVSDIESGVPELVQNGVNGFRVPIGDIEQFAKTIAGLERDLERRREISLNAYRTIKEGGYRTEDMVKQYIDLFGHVMQEAESGVYTRPLGEIIPPQQEQYLVPQDLGIPPSVFNFLREIYLKLSGGGLENESPNLFAKLLNSVMRRIYQKARSL